MMRQVLALAVLLLLVACRSAEDPGLSVTLIGVDGATWRIIDPLLERGELPNLARLIEAGVRAPLRSRLPLVSPPVWTTVATGVTREHHGIVHFRDEAGTLVTSHDRRSAALWEIASRAGLRSAVIGWWATYPAEPIDGVIVSERALKTRNEDVQAMFGGGLPPASYKGLMQPPETMGLLVDLLTPMSLAPARNEYEDQRARMRNEDAAVARSLVRLREAMGPFRLELVLLRGVDVLSHYFWKFYEPDASVYSAEERPSRREVKRYGDVIEEHYRYVDELLGELAAVPEPNRVVVVMSDHGFEAGRQPFHREIISGTHKSESAVQGIFVAAGGPVRAGADLGEVSILDIAPTLLRLLGLPIADDFEGRVLKEALDEDWRAAHPVTRVAHHPRGEWASQAESEETSPLDERLGEELRALGYAE